MYIALAIGHFIIDSRGARSVLCILSMVTVAAFPMPPEEKKTRGAKLPLLPPALSDEIYVFRPRVFETELLLDKKRGYCQRKY